MTGATKKTPLPDLLRAQRDRLSLCLDILSEGGMRLPNKRRLRVALIDAAEVVEQVLEAERA